MKRFDVVVAGGGSAGCALAARLSENADRTVCLLEAGPDYGPLDEGSWPSDLLDARALAFSHAWATDRDDRSQLRARVIGGCSSHNACAVIAGTAEDYDEWCDGWSHAALEPYLRRAEETLRAEPFPEHELTPWHRAFMSVEGAFAHPANRIGTVRWNAAFAYLDVARDRPNLTILGRTLVDHVEPGVVHTEHGPYGAGTIVLAAGAYGSPAILLRSGIGPGLAHDLPVGEGLTDHVGVGLGWAPSERLVADMDEFAAEHPVFMAQVTVRRPRDVFLFPAVEPGWDVSAAVFLMKPRSRGRVRLNGANPRTPLAIEHGFLADERDVAPLVEGVEELRLLVGREPLRDYVVRELRPGAELPAEAHVRANARGFFHPVGTCALGSVCDARGRVLGVDGIAVADASLMPTIPRANTNLSVIAVAERMVELI